MTDIVKQIEDRDTLWNRMIVDRDLDGIVNLYAEDAWFMTPGQPAFIGRAAIRSAWERLLSAPAMTLNITPGNIREIAPDQHALDRGSYELSSGTGPDRVIDVGKYLVLWTHQGNEWMISEDIFNSDA